ncbi:transcriptional regulator [Paraburkholderia ginsengiterrae]|uniref:Transcriptional regulator n=1 Tax=Paraburkholderia ginsengiterrae TaxID=1462993 RepID=A0A1A9N5Q3_9BURK|nr:helix-turn-helix transcriptional regulator [Paraburkholderia ginsengiterrae]OAJ57923.1 transcriptional regulator [Paraburkholderia ginsengiterrae]OAJ63080.1 transcriptional regulator [Paraburkholderia ginsengiterrae]
MNSANPVKKVPPNDLGMLLRHWRDMRGVSQLDLSLNAGVSQRHISFIESGRSVPSRQMLMDIAQTLDIPLRERNTLLLAAGYAPMYADGAWNAQEMHSVTRALGRMLRQHEPFPALVIDRYWNVLMTNDAAPRFFSCFIDMAAREGPRNMLHLIFDPDGMRPFVADWPGVADSLIRRVYRESVGRVVDDSTRELLDALRAYPDVPASLTPGSELAAGASADAMPVIPIGFVKDGRVMKYFSMVATVGTPQTIAAQELRLECMFPADDETEAWHLEMLDEASQRTH